MVVSLVVVEIPWGLVALVVGITVSDQKYWLIADPVSMGSQAPD